MIVDEGYHVLFEATRCEVHNSPECKVTQVGGPNDGVSIRWCLSPDAVSALARAFAECGFVLKRRSKR